MQSPKVSVIVPVYNTSKYLRKCLESIINQTLTDIQIIIVNDNSPDPLDHEICKYYDEHDRRITYIKHNTNLGLGGARNSGLGIANGAYVWFIDSDDFIDTNGCEFLYKLALEMDVDIVAFSATSHINGNLNLTNNKYYNYWRDKQITDKIFTGRDFIETAVSCDSFHVSACLHLFKRTFIKKFRFRENVFHEDTDLIPIIIHNANSVFCTKYPPYYRLLREDSITQREISEKAILDKFLCIKSLLEYIDSIDADDKNPLLYYTHKEFEYVQRIYTSYSKKSDSTEAAFKNLRERYTTNTKLNSSHFLHNNIWPGSSAIEAIKLKEELDSTKKAYSHIKTELDTIKHSLFWKVTGPIWRIKSKLKI